MKNFVSSEHKTNSLQRNYNLINKGGDYVQNSQKKVFTRKLRLLNSVALKNLCKAQGLEGILPFHLTLLKKSFFLYENIFDSMMEKSSPLWIQLLSNDLPSRRFSNEIVHSLSNQFRRFGVDWKQQFKSKKLSLKEQYRFGVHFEDNNPKPSCIISTKLHYLNHKKPFSSSDSSEFIDSDVKRASLICFCFTNRLVSTSELENAYDELTRISERLSVNIETEADLLFFIKVSNILNLYHFKKENLDLAEKMTLTICQKIAYIKTKRIKSHFKGINSFHLSMIENARKNQEKELYHLQDALMSDFGFFDYHYRLASILHDKGQKTAQMEYERALSLGPIDEAIATDYGCLLQELNNKELLRSWENVCRLFGFFDEE